MSKEKRIVWWRDNTKRDSSYESMAIDPICLMNQFSGAIVLIGLKGVFWHSVHAELVLTMVHAMQSLAFTSASDFFFTT